MSIEVKVIRLPNGRFVATRRGKYYPHHVEDTELAARIWGLKMIGIEAKVRYNEVNLILSKIDPDYNEDDPDGWSMV